MPRRPAAAKEKKPPRPHGTGSISADAKSGRWRAQVVVGGQRVGKTFATRREAAQWIKTTQADAARGLLPGAGGKTPLADYLQDWLTYVQPTLEPTSYADYESKVRLHLSPALGHIPLG